MLALAYVESDREDEGNWWAKRGGQLVMETIAIRAQLMGLPEDRIGPPEEQ